jgi:hypothetical protein
MMIVVEARVDTTFRDLGLKIEVAVPTETLIMLVEARLRDAVNNSEITRTEAKELDENWRTLSAFMKKFTQ